MRTLFSIVIMLTFAFHANAQYVTVTNLAGTTAYGSTNVTVTTTGSVASTPWCGVNPYWIGSGGPGSYIFNFSSPKDAVRIYVTAMNVLGSDTEKISVFINGTFYNLTPANLTVYPGTCAQPTQPIIGGMLVCTAAPLGVGGGGQLDIYQCGITSCEVFTNGVLNGSTFTFQFDSTAGGSCLDAWTNNPCIGDSLHLKAIGDSTGATYVWSGPGGFTSTDQNLSKFPAAFSDTGNYMVIRTKSGTLDTSYVHVSVHPSPVISLSNNSPICSTGGLLTLFQTPSITGGTYLWSGPTGFTSTLQNPTRAFTIVDTGYYKLVATTAFGCKDSGTTHVTETPPPPSPTITGQLHYCQGQIFVPFTVTGYTGTLRWYTVPTGGTSSPSAPSVPTSFPGLYSYWVSQIIGSCESNRSSITVKVTATPPAPFVTGPTQYCQYIGPIVNSTVFPSDSAGWYTSPIGGSPSYIQPLPDINIPGTLNTWVSRIDSGCEGPRTPVSITIHPKPSKPNTVPKDYCQFKTANPINLSVTASGAGNTLTYYGPGVTSGMITPPTPTTSVAPDTIVYYITETTVFGCVSDSAIHKVVIKLKPAPPTVTDLQYCQKDIARPLNEVVDSDFNSTLNWYYNSISLPPIPVPFTDTTPGTRMWFVGQTVPAVNGCASDSIPIKVTIIYKPKFSIEATSPWVCQFDTVTLAYKGPALYQPEYLWTFPRGAAAVNFTDRNDSIVQVKFDSTHQDNIVYLRASNHNGFCYSDTSIKIKVIPLPTMEAYTKPDVCFGDTVQLALATKADNSHSYTWWVDDTTMEHARALSIISRNSHSSGPYTISWLDSGRHIIKVSSTTVEGCKSEPTFDSVLVHNPPDARFRISSGNQGKICWEDSVQFTALTEDYRNSYEWAPAHDFDNLNSPIIWGKMLGQKNTIILKVTDPFGCYATESMQIDPEYCCTIQFPNAFTPNGTGPQDNNIFKPYFVGYHRFHMFRIMNRWGQIIFESANSSVMGWDGTFNGVPQDVGVYYYYLRYDCGGKSMEAKGDVTLIR